MQLNQVFEIFDLDNPLLKSVFSDESGPRCDARWFLGTNVPKLPPQKKEKLKHFVYIKKKKEEEKRKKKKRWASGSWGWPKPFPTVFIFLVYLIIFEILF